MKNNKLFMKILSALLAMTFIITIPVSTAFAASCNHNYPTGNCGSWFNTKSEGEYQVAVVADY